MRVSALCSIRWFADYSWKSSAEDPSFGLVDIAVSSVRSTFALLYNSLKSLPSFVQHSLPCYWEWFKTHVESRKGVSPLRSHRTVRETLASYGSSCSITNVIKHYGRTNFQCGKSKGLSLYFFLSHIIAAFLYRPFSHFTHLYRCTFSCRHKYLVWLAQNLQ